MLNKLLERLTGRDDLERVALKEDVALLNQCLKTRRVWIPQQPKRFLDPNEFSQEKLLEMIEKECEELSQQTIHLWVLETDGKKWLPIFSSRKRMEVFSREISKRINKVFGLGCTEELLADVLKQVEVDVVQLNLYSDKSWEIEVRKFKNAVT